MKKLYSFLAGAVLFASTVTAQDYPTNYTESDKSTYNGRYPNSIMLTSDEYGNQTIDWASGSYHALYKDATATELTCAAGEEVQIVVNYQGIWMSSYIYIDLNDDKQFGYDVDEENHCYKEGSELVSWSFYSFAPETSEDPGWNSLGTPLTGSARSTVNCPKFTAPTEAGTYRCRVKIDWNSIDPAGSVAGHLGGAMSANGGGIIDFTLKVVAAFAPVTIQINQANGSWTATNDAGTWAAKWLSTAINPSVSLSCANNNMAYDSNGDPKLYTGLVTKRACPYTLTTQDDYVITDYSFNTATIDGQWSSITTEDGEEIVTPGLVQVTGINKQSTSFTVNTNEDNKGVQLSNFTVTITKSTGEKTKQTIFIYDKTVEHNVVYRIPSIASIPAGENKGRIVAITDYRPGGSDVGGGEVDLHAKYSDDYGQTWSDEIVVVDGLGNDSNGSRWFSFGDPVSIADRESGKLLLVSCSGHVMYPSATRSNHQGVEVYYSEDGGATWSAPNDVSEQIYSQLDAIGIQSLFVGSGGFTQSKFVKKGEYYRIYGGILCRTSSGGGINYAIYTDDLGATWNVLGGYEAKSITSGGDEAKVEELPDGSVLHSSRVNGGRIFNIWRWTDDTYTDGAWDGQVTSSGSNNGIVAGNNSCNGEILIVPAKRVADDKCVYLAMQSIPFGSGRANVGIYWKELPDLASFATTSAFAADWTKGKQVSYLGSAYSAMVLQEDGNVGFLVEEETYGYGYSQVYHRLSYEDITDGAYTFISESDENFDRSAFDVARGTVTYNLQWDGVTEKTVTMNVYYGEMLPTPNGLPDFTEADGIPATTMSDAINGQTYDVTVMWSASAPFQLSDNMFTEHYYLQIREGQCVWYDNTKDYIDLSTTTNRVETTFMWHFEGNPFTGIKLYTYDNKVLASADPEGDGNTGMNTHPYPYDEEAVPTGYTTDWLIKSSTYYNGGFYMFNAANGYAMNYRSPYLAYWTGGFDSGSTFRVTEVPAEDLLAVGVNTVKANNETKAVYNLSGQRVVAPKQGLYIISGKKVVVK